MEKFEIDYKKRIEENFRRLNAIVKMFNKFEFYDLKCDVSSVQLQGTYKPEIVSFAMKHKFTISASDFGYIKLNREFKNRKYSGIYVITLTD
jgi:hypothetical protein